MSEAHKLGLKGEDLAADFLEKAGYKILRRNFRWGQNEVDIIAENEEFLVFAEVKTRAGDYLEAPAAAVNRDKQRALIRAADGYININHIDKESRFDVITVIMKGKEFTIDHIESAFYPTLR